MTATLPSRLVRAAALATLLLSGASLSAAQTKQTDARRNAPQASNNRENPGMAAREICIRVEMSGTRMPRRVCKTPAEWEAEGGVPRGN